MTQYLLRCTTTTTRESRPWRRCSRCSRRSTPSTRRSRDAGIWVFAGGLSRSSGHGRRRHRATSRSSPTARTSRPRSGSAASGSSSRPTSTRRCSGPTEASKACARQGRGPAVPGRVTARSDRTPRRSSGSTARSTAGSSPRWSAASATSTSPRTRPARRCWPRSSGGPRDGVPPNPGGWLTTTAGNRAIDRIRRESHRDAKHQAALMITDDTPHEPTGPVEDDRLRLIFTCCHPALAPEARVALTLRLLGGLTVAEIAPGVPRPRDDDGAADHPRQEEDRGREDPLPRARGGGPRRAARRRARGALPGLQRGLPVHAGDAPDPRRADRRGDPAGPDPARRCCPTSPRSTGCSR